MCQSHCQQRTQSDRSRARVIRARIHNLRLRRAIVEPSFWLCRPHFPSSPICRDTRPALLCTSVAVVQSATGSRPDRRPGLPFTSLTISSCARQSQRCDALDSRRTCGMRVALCGRLEGGRMRTEVATPSSGHDTAGGHLTWTRAAHRQCTRWARGTAPSPSPSPSPACRQHRYGQLDVTLCVSVPLPVSAQDGDVVSTCAASPCLIPIRASFVPPALCSSSVTAWSPCAVAALPVASLAFLTALARLVYVTSSGSPALIAFFSFNAARRLETTRQLCACCNPSFSRP